MSLAIQKGLEGEFCCYAVSLFHMRYPGTLFVAGRALVTGDILFGRCSNEFWLFLLVGLSYSVIHVYDAFCC
jgi:hypothetical protein